MKSARLFKLDESINTQLLESLALMREIKKELGERNWKALIKSEKLTLTDKRTAFKNIKNGKKITQKRFLECCNLHSEHLNVLAAARRQKSFFMRDLKMKYRYVKNAELHKRINSGDCGIASAKRKRLKIVTDFISIFAPGVSGSRDISASFTKNPQNVKYTSYTTKGASYSRRCTFRTTDLSVHATLPHHWWSRVYKQGFQIIDGMFTLDISSKLKINTDSDVEVRAAKWLVKSRGTAYNTVDGFIAFLDGATFHGKTVKSAIAGVQRKLAHQNLIKLPKNAIIEKAKKANSIHVSLRDSYAVGNCEWGTLDFCHRHNIDIDDKNNTIELSKLAEIAEKEPRPEVIAVLVHKLK